MSTPETMPESQSTKPKPLPPPPTSENEDPVEHHPKHEYEYDIPDYYEYEHEEPVRNARKPVKEAEDSPNSAKEDRPQSNRQSNREPNRQSNREPNRQSNKESNRNSNEDSNRDSNEESDGPDGQMKARPPSVKRIGWLPEDPDSDDLNKYHWSPKDAVSYAEVKPRIPDEAYVNMNDFKNVDKQLDEDDGPNVGPENEAENPDEDPDYSDYYEDDEEHPPSSEDEDYHSNDGDKEGPPSAEDEDDRTAPLVDKGSSKQVRYDDEDEVRQQPRVSPPGVGRPPIRNQVPSRPVNNYSSRPAQPPLPPSPHPNPNPNREYIPKREPFQRIKTSEPKGEDEIAGSLNEYDNLVGLYKNYFHK